MRRRLQRRREQRAYEKRDRFYDGGYQNSPRPDGKVRHFTVSAPGAWGRTITWDEFPYRLHGWWSPLPCENDILLSDRLESGRTGAWRFAKVRACGDPQDMFFAEMEPLGYTDEINLPEDDAPRSMFV